MRCIASSLKFLWYGSMEWNMEENFSMEWNIFSMEWKWNGRKLPVWNMKKSSSIPYHALPMVFICLAVGCCTLRIIKLSRFLPTLKLRQVCSFCGVDRNVADILDFFNVSLNQLNLT